MTPLKEIFNAGREDCSIRRNIFLLTDGAVWDTEKVVSEVQMNALSQNTCVHTFGIGSDCSKELVTNVARAGNGTCSLITNLEEIEERVISSLKKVILPGKIL